MLALYKKKLFIQQGLILDFSDKPAFFPGGDDYALFAYHAVGVCSDAVVPEPEKKSRMMSSSFVTKSAIL